MDVFQVSSKAAVGAGLLEGLVKAATNTPPDAPYLLNNPVYITSSDFFSSLKTIYEQSPNEKK